MKERVQVKSLKVFIRIVAMVFILAAMLLSSNPVCSVGLEEKTVPAVPGGQFVYEMIGGVRVIEGQRFTKELIITGAEWNNAIIRNNEFVGQSKQALHISDVHGLRVENNLFSDMTGFAVKLKDYQQGTSDVVIQGNRFKNLENTAILVGEPNNNVRIFNNVFENVALDTEGDKKHAMYLKGPDFLVEGNIIIGVGDAHGVSVRTSGVVRGNYIEAANEDGIKYFSSSSRKGSGTLLIENNILVRCQHGGIGFDASKDGVMVDRVIVRFNTAVNNSRGIWLYEGLDAVSFSVYGNLFVEENGKFFYLKKEPEMIKENITQQKVEGFVDFAGRDFRLLPSSPAVNAVPGVPGPFYDFGGNSMGGEPYDAGAFQLQ